MEFWLALIGFISGLFGIVSFIKNDVIIPLSQYKKNLFLGS